MSLIWANFGLKKIKVGRARDDCHLVEGRKKEEGKCGSSETA